MIIHWTKEIFIDEDFIIEQNEDEWNEFSKSNDYSVEDFVKYLVEENIVSPDDLGEVDYEEFTVL